MHWMHSRNQTELSEYKITTYTYDPLAGVSITPPSGIRENYKYNNKYTNRLELVSDVNNKVLKEYQYHYPILIIVQRKNKSFHFKIIALTDLFLVHITM